MNYEISMSDIIALSFSIIALYITLKNRRNSLRENLYDRQISAFEVIMADLVDIEDCLGEYLAQRKYDKKEMEVYRTKALEEMEKFSLFELKKSLLMPDKIDIEIGKIVSELSVITGKIYSNEFTDEDSNKLGDKIFDLQEEIRSFIGLEELSRENQRLTKTIGRGMTR